MCLDKSLSAGFMSAPQRSSEIVTRVCWCLCFRLYSLECNVVTVFRGKLVLVQRDFRLGS